MIQAIIFDFDGTILETEYPDYLCWQETFQEHQCELPYTLWLNAVGGSAIDFDPYGYLEQQIGRTVDRAALTTRRRERMHALITQERIRPGVIDVIAGAQRLGIHLGVASSSKREWVEGYLTRFGLREPFEVICTRDDVERVKPDPALYRLAVNKLGIQPAAAVAIEDSRNGMMAAKAAGLKCVVVPNEVTQQLSFSEADLQMQSLADRPLEEWLSALQSISQIQP
jgi:HAD superfamily hydrolase (TIGR01509 family)